MVAKVDWKEEVNTPVTPKLIGSRAFIDFPIEDVLEYIDWCALLPSPSCL